MGYEKPRYVSPEYHQKAGLYVHDRPEQVYYPLTSATDVTNLVAVHLEQVLPFNAQVALKEIFEDVELKEPGPEIKFKTPELAGYFEIKIQSVRYDFPDSNANNFRADVELLVAFRTLDGRTVWKEFLSGTGIGFSSTDIRLTRFGRDQATALEDAFQRAVDQLPDAVLRSETLRNYLRETKSLDVAGTRKESERRADNRIST